MDLVVGATGTVGTEVVQQLSAAGRAVRAFVRHDATTTSIAHLPNVELAVGDLFDPPSAERALLGCTHVIACANGVAPRKRRDHRRLERHAYPPFIGAARDHGVRRFVYLSMPMPTPGVPPMQRDQGAVEEHLCSSGLEFTIVRACALMEHHLIVPRGPSPGPLAPTASARPELWFTEHTRRRRCRALGVHGELMIDGDPDRRFSFISARDVASILIAATTHPLAFDAVLEVGGPEALSWREVAQRYERVLGREVRIRARRPGMVRASSRLLRPVSRAAADLLDHEIAAIGGVIRSPAVAGHLGVGPLLRVEDHLRQRVPTTRS